MDMMTLLKSKNSTKAYQLLLMLERESEESDGLYGNLDDFLTLLQDKSSLVRTRGFRLICAQARWDRAGWIGEHLEEVLTELEDGKATAVRQCLTALHQVVGFRPELWPQIEKKLNGMDLSKYKESMAPLLQKNMEELQAVMKEGADR